MKSQFHLHENEPGADNIIYIQEVWHLLINTQIKKRTHLLVQWCKEDGFSYLQLELLKGIFVCECEPAIHLRLRDHAFNALPHATKET